MQYQIQEFNAHAILRDTDTKYQHEITRHNFIKTMRIERHEPQDRRLRITRVNYLIRQPSNKVTHRSDIRLYSTRSEGLITGRLILDM